MTDTQVELTDEQRTKFLEHLQADKTAGIIATLRAAGVTGSRGQLRRLYDSDVQLQEQAREARGWNINRVEGVTWEVAVDPNHPSWDRANARLLKAYGGQQFRDQSRVELTGADGGPVQTEDRSATLGDVKRILDAAVGSTAAGGEVADAR